MSIEFYRSKIAESMKRRGIESERGNLLDFMHAVKSVDTVDDASMFYEGAIEWDAEQQGALKLDEIKEGVEEMILYSLNGIRDAEERVERRQIWREIFDPLDEILPQKEIVNG